MKPNKFQEILSFYGSNPEQWPEEIRVWWDSIAQKNPDLLLLLAQEKVFESQLKSFPIPRSENLAEKIILEANLLVQSPFQNSITFWEKFRKESPIPLYILAFSLVIGVCIGLNIPTKYEEEMTQPKMIALFPYRGDSNGD